MKNINASNWSYCYYQEGDLKAFISLGGCPQEDSGEIILLYLVTTSDADNKELFQSEFEVLEEAVADITRRFGHWDLVDARLAAAKASEGGCGSCQAH